MSIASLLILAAVASLIAAPGRADDGCPGGRMTLSGRIAGIELPAGTGRPTVRLSAVRSVAGSPAATDETAVLLDGLIIPATASAEAGAASRAVAADLAGQTVALVADRAAADRHGRRPGMLRLDDGDDLSAHLIAAGAGLADVSSTPCASRFLAAEAEARAERRGIWRQSRLWTDLNRATPGLPDYVLGRGRVASVGQAGRTTYINFGDNFRTDATVRLTAATASALTSAGHPPGALAGQRVEVRGFAAERDGLDLLLVAPEALVIVGAMDVRSTD